MARIAKAKPAVLEVYCGATAPTTNAALVPELACQQEPASSTTKHLCSLVGDKADAKRGAARKRAADDKTRTNTLVQALASTAASQPVDAATRMAAIRARLTLS